MNSEKPEKSDFWKNEIYCWRYHFTHVPKNTVTWGTVPEIQSETALLSLLPNNPENQNFEKMKKTSGDVIILNLRNQKHDHMIYAYSDMECDRHNCHFRPFFPLLPHYWPRKLKFGKNVKKNWIYYPFTNVYHKSRSYDVWFLRLPSWTILCPFTPLTVQKTKISKKKKKPGDIILHKCTKNPDHRLYCSWDMACDECNCYFHFGLYFSLLLPP